MSGCRKRRAESAPDYESNQVLQSPQDDTHGMCFPVLLGEHYHVNKTESRPLGSSRTLGKIHPAELHTSSVPGIESLS